MNVQVICVFNFSKLFFQPYIDTEPDCRIADKACNLALISHDVWQQGKVANGKMRYWLGVPHFQKLNIRDALTWSRSS